MSKGYVYVVDYGVAVKVGRSTEDYSEMLAKVKYIREWRKT